MLGCTFADACWSEVPVYIWTVYTSLKTSAIWGGNKILFAASFFLSLTPVLTDILETADYRNAYSLQFRCYGRPPSTSLRSYMIICVRIQFDSHGIQAARATCAVLLLQDILILSLTLAKTLHQWWITRGLGFSFSITTSILRGGASIVLHAVAPPNLKRLYRNGALSVRMHMGIVGLRETLTHLQQFNGIMEEVLSPSLLRFRLIMELRTLLQDSDSFNVPSAAQSRIYFHRSIREVEQSLSLLNSTFDDRLQAGPAEEGL
ncbi:uncharacterized protein PHACADRAFT_182158 [Phanerochaete carnosa HHB-10118-sp]|uniref:Uncharacterized protein n=1 Tax=Phanerochaete carnosa (strain HHB-10118-sp) TaxID=650164 RepID=K5WEH7_PHACS|nr:uncharacterized protein PHACADRAFT_182158 [Phanerochaete carnosa HHB-10118-sp]EKM57700.1 hypothetical protein PHACADRAFT_182158 [Phanerochaete carnosa HHB-10118-sp]